MGKWEHFQEAPDHFLEYCGVIREINDKVKMKGEEYSKLPFMGDRALKIIKKLFKSLKIYQNYSEEDFKKGRGSFRLN
jgi:hypothetical protein